MNKESSTEKSRVHQNPNHKSFRQRHSAVEFLSSLPPPAPWDVSFVADVHTYLLSCEPTEEHTARRDRIVMFIRDRSRSLLNCEVIEHGSAFNGFGTGLSDLDLALSVDGATRDELFDAAHEIRAAIRGDRSARDVQLIPSRIVLVTAKIEGIDIDISFNNAFVDYRTPILRMCANYDPVVRFLGLIIKYWGKQRGVCSGATGHFASYHWTLMLIYFLMKKGIIDHVLFTKDGSDYTYQPISQQTYQSLVEANEQRKDKSLTIRGRTLESQVDDSCFQELLREFFEYYAYHFDFEVHIVCIRTEAKTPLTKTAYSEDREPHKAWPKGWCVCDFGEPGRLKMINAKQRRDTKHELERAAAELRKGGGKLFDLKPTKIKPKGEREGRGGRKSVPS